MEGAQCLPFVFAAIGVYQYVLRDRIIGGDSPDNELLDMDVDEMDVSTQFLFVEMLANDHRNQSRDAAAIRQTTDVRSA